ncbi:hypothetical protein BDV29DRAFT_155287 [Aspergillus leporis]|jgi:hypothetical protein|uniref:Uncharacterized protein n=1 Tax=Aspergillus leporis TaxID=41062 RepID=A0A5N5X5G4_9EURO|nr:hypothetical protein BDV29DRAFT_155287 [Aspergillus leporis]
MTSPEILLDLFVPWQHLVSYFLCHAPADPIERGACADVWAAVEPTLTPYIRNFPRNIAVLQKFKEDCRANTELWKRSGCVFDFFDHDIDEPELSPCNPNNDELFQAADETVNADALITAFHSIGRLWNREMHASAAHIAALCHATCSTQDLRLQNFQPFNICNYDAWETPGLRLLPSTALQDWGLHLKNLPTLLIKVKQLDLWTGAVASSIFFTDGERTLPMLFKDLVNNLGEIIFDPFLA